MTTKHADTTKPTGTMKQAGTMKKAFWLKGPFLLAVIPLALFVLCLLALAWHEKRAADRLQSEIARIRDAGYPLDDASMNQWFIQNTSREGTQDWNEILRLVQVGPPGFGNVERLPYVGTATAPTDIGPVEAWTKQSDVAEYLRSMRPVMGQIAQATEHPTPVWQPIEFEGYGTLLEELHMARGVARLLQLELDDALHHRDAERALRTLRAMDGVAAAFDWPICVVCDLVQSALRQTHQSSVRRALQVDIWDDEQLRRLSDQLGPPREIPQRWQDVFAGERAMMMSSLDEPDLWASEGPPAPLHRWLFNFPSSRERLLDAYRNIETVGLGRLDALPQRAETLADQWRSDGDAPQSLALLSGNAYQTFLPGIEGYASALEREETVRRFAKTAVAIKRFQLQKGDWPDRLGQLEQVGLEPIDWHTVPGHPFGYEPADDRAYLWSYESWEERHIPSERPAATLEKGQPNQAVTTIR